jgi:hypothetical protein
MPIIKINIQRFQKEECERIRAEHRRDGQQKPDDYFSKQKDMSRNRLHVFCFYFF